MDSRLFAASPCGRVLRVRSGYDAFVPNPLPPSLDWNGAVREVIEQAGEALGRFSRAMQSQSGAAGLLLRVDAMHAAHAEGQACTLRGLLQSEAAGRPANDGAQLALNYVAAFEHAAARLDELPLSLRLVREMHYVLADGAVDPSTTPGYFRRSQNWLGPAGCALDKADFVPPPPAEMGDLMHNWEQYLHANDDTPPVARVAIAHYQLLLLHPFLSLNAALACLAASFILHVAGVVGAPSPLPGAFAGRSSAEFAQRALGLARTGAWDDWLLFYACGLTEAALGASEALRRLREVTEGESALLARTSEDGAARRLAELLHERPVQSLATLAGAAGLSRPDALEAVERLAALGIAEWRPEAGLALAPAVIDALEPRGMSARDYGVFF